MVFLAAVVFGALSYQRLPVTLMPELSYPTLTVRTQYPGAAPEEVENDISRRLEETLGIVGGLRRMSSISRAGVSDVVLEFSWDTSMADAVQDTLEKLDLVLLPQEAERPLILRFDPSLDPVMELSLSGHGDRFEGPDGLRRLRRIAELQVKRALEPIKGVAAVRVRGGLEEEIHVLLDAERMRRTGLPATAVIDRLAQENINLAGGTLEEGRTEFMVRTVNEYADLEQIRQTIVTRVDGREVRVQDLGRVEMSNRDREIITRSGGRESVQLDVFKEADANMVALADRIVRTVGELDLEKEAARSRGEALEEPQRGFRFGPPGRNKKPDGLATNLYRAEGVELQVVADRSEFIEASIADVRNTAILGGVLAVIVLYLFLRNAVTTLIVAVSIPISLLITFAPLHALGVSLNIMSLGGLALGIGMLVDSSIVVLESIHRCRQDGDSVYRAAVRGTYEVRSAVIASILTSIAVFFPMVFVEGIAGQAFGDLGLAVVFSLLASMAVALFFIPMLASREKPAQVEEGGKRDWRRIEAFRILKRDRVALLAWAARGGFVRRLLLGPAFLFLAVRFVLGTVLELVGKFLLGVLFGLSRVFAGLWGLTLFVRDRLAAFVGSLAGVLGLSGLGSRTSSVYPSTLRFGLRHPGIIVALLVGVLAASWYLLTDLETELLPEVRQGEFTFEVALPVGTPVAETERTLAGIEQSLLANPDGVGSLLVTYGFDPETSQSSDEGEHTARFKVLTEGGPETEDSVVARIRRELLGVPDLTSRVARPVLFSFKTPIEVEVEGEDLSQLRRVTQDVQEELAALDELADVETTLRAGAPEVQIIYDRERLSRYEMGISQIAEQVRNQIKGYEATLYNLKDRRIPIVVRLEEADRRSTEDLSGLVINPGAERPIPLSAVAEIRQGEGASEIRRSDGRRVGLIRANLGDASLGGAVAAIERLLSEREWARGMTYTVGGQSQEWERSSGSLWLALLLSVFLVYVIMAAQFESLVQPLVIMFTIPLAFFGTFLTLWLLDVNLSIVVFLGMIMLAGIVVNNAIVMVDYINTLRRRGQGREQAIVTAGTIRLRPILMTTATTALGLVPMALGIGEGAEIRTPMALAVIGGLVSSTFLTLLVVPVIYLLIDRTAGRILGREVLAMPGDNLRDGERDTPVLEGSMGAPS